MGEYKIFYLYDVMVEGFDCLYIPSSISCPPCTWYDPPGRRLTCSQTGETILNLLLNNFAMSYPWLFH